MWRKHRSVFQYHVKYICNDVVNIFRLGILQYAERVHELNDLFKYLPLPLMKGNEYD